MKLKEEIFKLKALGFSYSEIVKELGCAKSTVAFHLGEGQKEKTNLRNQKRFKNDPLIRKIQAFSTIRTDIKTTIISRSIDKILYIKYKHFNSIRDKKVIRKYKTPEFTVEDLKNKIGSNPKCYLTGDSIDLSKSQEYQLDHKIPKSKGGNDSLENCQIATKAANQSKYDMNLEEYLELCKKVLEYNGYNVEKI